MRYLYLCLFIIGLSCSDDPQISDLEVIELKAGEEYVLDLGLQRAIFRPDGIAEAEFIRQAKKASNSQLQFVVSGLGLEDPVLYRYSPKSGVTGMDYVEFVVCYSENCDHENSSKEFYKIYFLISD